MADEKQPLTPAQYEQGSTVKGPDGNRVVVDSVVGSNGSYLFLADSNGTVTLASEGTVRDTYDVPDESVTDDTGDTDAKRSRRR